MEVKLYRREIRPIMHNCFCAMGVHPTDTVVEDKWFPESEENMLKEKYVSSDPYETLVFQERFVDCGDSYIILKAEDYPNGEISV